MSADTNHSFDFGLAEHALADSVSVAGHRLSVTPVFFAYWRFAAERQDIFYRRLVGQNHITSDPVLSRFKFTNTYRASDRVSQYLIRHVIYRDDLPRTPAEIFFRVLLFKIFNRIDTWEYLRRELGEITYEGYAFDAFDDALTRRMADQERIYSAAYIMPSAGSVFGYKAKHQNHLRLIEYMIARGYPERLADCRSMADAYEIMLAAPSIGPFLAYQYVTDLNYSALTDFSEADFVVAGPGALDGIDKCFEAHSSVRPADVIRYMHDNQERHFAEQEIDFRNLWGRRLQLIDCQNIFCEISKYARVAFPEFAGVAGRTRIKQKFVAGAPLPSPWYPPKWALNPKIETVRTI